MAISTYIGGNFSDGSEGKVKIVVLKYSEEKFYGFIDADEKCFNCGTGGYTPKLKEADSIKQLKRLIKKDREARRVLYSARDSKIKKFDLTTGEVFLPSMRKTKHACYCEELKKFSKSSERILVALHMLSAIIERKYTKCSDENPSNAGILNVKVKKGQSVEKFMKSIAGSFSCNRTGKKGVLKFFLPSYLPHDNRKEKIKDNAFITDKRTRTLSIAPVYPDTAVVLDARMLKAYDVVKFVKGNDHCQVVLVGSTAGKLNNLVAGTIIAENLATGDLSWDVTTLQKMTQAFTAADIEKKKIKAAIKKVKPLINSYLGNSGTKASSDLRYAELYLVTAELLIDFLNKADQMSEEETAELRNTLLNAVLPGCYTPPKDSGVALENIALTPENFEDALREVISKAVEDTSKLSIPSGREWDESSAAPESACYGYLTEMEVDKTHKNKVPSIQFRYEVFLDLFEKFCPYKAPERTQVESWLRNYIVGKGLAYCHDRDRSRDRFGADGLKPSVRLLIHNLDFLAEEKRQELLDVFDTKRYAGRKVTGKKGAERDIRKTT